MSDLDKILQIFSFFVCVLSGYYHVWFIDVLFFWLSHLLYIARISICQGGTDGHVFDLFRNHADTRLEKLQDDLVSSDGNVNNFLFGRSSSKRNGLPSGITFLPKTTI